MKDRRVKRPTKVHRVIEFRYRHSRLLHFRVTKFPGIKLASVELLVTGTNYCLALHSTYTLKQAQRARKQIGKQRFKI